MPRSIALEILAEALRETASLRSTSVAKMEHRRYAEILADALERYSVGFTSYPKVVRVGALRSTRALREIAGAAWSRKLDETGDQVTAFEAAIRATLAHQRQWTVRDACLHTLKFVLPGDVKDG